MTIWSQYIGTPWEKAADGPHAYNCWNFFRMIQREHYGIEVGAVAADEDVPREYIDAFRSHPDRAQWRCVDRPAEGDGVEVWHLKYPWHIGVWIDVDGGGLLHCVRGMGVIFSRAHELPSQGFSRTVFYRHESRA
jgi:hypothetical protein